MVGTSPPAAAPEPWWSHISAFHRARASRVPPSLGEARRFDPSWHQALSYHAWALPILRCREWQPSPPQVSSQWLCHCRTRQTHHKHPAWPHQQGELSIPIKRQGYLDMYHGINVLQARNYIKISTSTLIMKILESTSPHGWIISPPWLIGLLHFPWTLIGSKSLMQPLVTQTVYDETLCRGLSWSIKVESILWEEEILK